MHAADLFSAIGESMLERRAALRLAGDAAHRGKREGWSRAVVATANADDLARAPPA